MGRIRIVNNMRTNIVCSWIAASFFSVFTSTSYAYYLVFIIQCIFLIQKRRLNKENTLELALFSCLLPNNYIPIVFCLFAAFLMIDYKRIARQSLIISGLIVFGFLLSICINQVPFPNMFFSIVYTLPSLLVLLVFRDCWDAGMEETVRMAVRDIFWILFFSTIANLSGKIIGIYRAIPGDDWSTGTFGDGQGNPLFMIISIIFLLNIDDILHKKNIKIGICSIIMLIASHSYVLLAAFAIAFLIGLIGKFGLLKGLKIIIPVMILGYFTLRARGYDKMLWGILSNPSWGTIEGLFPKIKVIGGSFEVLTSSFKNFVFGVGPGQYSSRAAATCTGLYVNLYNMMFEPSISIWTQKYVYQSIYNGFLDSGGEAGSILRLPYSSFASIIAETGLIGIVCSIMIGRRLLYKANKSASLILCFFIIASLFDNWIEYIKVTIFLAVCFCLCLNRKEQ